MDKKGNISQRLAKNAAALSIAQIARIGFGTVLSLLVARKLGAEGLGKYAVLNAYLQIFQMLAKVGVNRLAVREMARKPKEGRDWFQRTLVNQVLGAGGSAVALILIANLLNHPADTTRALEIAALSLLPFAMASASESAFQAKEQMGFTALAQVIARGSQVIGSVLLLLAGHGIVALAWMFVVGQCLVVIIEINITRRMGLWQNFSVDLRMVFTLYRQSWEFFVQSILVIVFTKIDVLILSQIVGEKATGLYNAAYLVIRVINFLSASYSEAAYPVLSRLFVKARASFETMISKSLLFGVAGALLIALWLEIAAEPIIGLLYPGKDYATSVSLLRIEAPFVVIFMWNALLAKGLMSSGHQRYSVIVSGIKLGIGLICHFALTTWLGVEGTAMATVLAALSGTILNYYFFEKVYALDLVTLVVKPLTIGALLLILLWVTQGLAWPGLIVGGTLLYLSLLIVFRIFSKQDLRLLWQTVRPLQTQEPS